MKAYQIIVKGRVQGVGYRWFARQSAEELGIRGYVRNLPNGDVEVLAQGDDETVDALIERLRRGPSFAHVMDIQAQETNIKQRLDRFEVRL